jgi:hypothetical protein
MFYLALFLCSKFAIAVPFLPSRSASETVGARYDPDDPLHFEPRAALEDARPPYFPYRNRAAAPPVYLLALPLVPICAAIYITSTRFAQFYHHGFDLMFGSAIGILSSWFSFRLYHLPISRGAGWSWGARSRNRAWGITIGQGGYVGPEGWSNSETQHLNHAVKPNELGNRTDTILGPGLPGPLEDIEGRAR